MIFSHLFNKNCMHCCLVVHCDIAASMMLNSVEDN